MYMYTYRRVLGFIFVVVAETGLIRKTTHESGVGSDKQHFLITMKHKPAIMGCFTCNQISTVEGNSSAIMSSPRFIKESAGVS